MSPSSVFLMETRAKSQPRRRRNAGSSFMEAVRKFHTGSKRLGVFENMIIMEVLKTITNTHSTADIYFYRDSNKNEVDLVVNKGRIFDLYEIKSGKSIKPIMAKKLQNIDLKPARRFILSFNESELVFAGGEVKAVPWWTICKIQH